MRTPLFRYFSEEAYARAFIDKGEVYLRPLAYFQAFEDRAGAGRSRRRHVAPRARDRSGGLTKRTGRSSRAAGGLAFPALRPKGKMNFVYCLSLERSEHLAAKFKSPFCVEVRDPIRDSLQADRRPCVCRSRLDPRVYQPNGRLSQLASPHPASIGRSPERVAFIAGGWARAERPSHRSGPERRVRCREMSNAR